MPSAKRGCVVEGRGRRVHVGRIDEFVRGLRSGQLGLEGAVGRVIDFLVHFRLEFLETLFRKDAFSEKERGHRLDGVVLGLALALLFGAVERLVVGERMAVGPDDVRMDESGSLALPAVLRRVAQGVVGPEEVAPVHFRDEETGEAAHELRDRASGRVDFDRDRYRVTVVFDQEKDGQLQSAGRRERFPELSFGSLPFASRHDGDLILVKAPLFGELGDQALAPSGLGRSNRLEELRAGGRRLGDDVQTPGPPVRGHLPPGRGGVLFGARGLEKHLVGGHAELEAAGPVAVIEKKPVVGGLRDHRGRRRDGFMAGAADLEVDLVLPLELDLLVVHPAGEVDVSVSGDERGGIQPGVLARLDFSRHALNITRPGPR